MKLWIRFAILASLAIPGAAGAPPEKPAESGLTEKVEVRLVTLEVTVLDTKDRPVPGLRKEDFELEVDRKLEEIASVDEDCGGPREADVPAGDAAPSDGGARRLVIALDYLHLPFATCGGRGSCDAHTQVLDRLERFFREKPALDEDVMLVALTGSLRMEQPFTRDRQALLAALARMKDDPSLYAGDFAHATEEPLFRGLRALMAVMGSQPGRKAVALFTAGGGPSNARYEEDFRRLAALASDARVALYTVDGEGLQAGFS